MSAPRRQSLWLDTLGEPPQATAPLDRDTEVDVAIVGAGFTGLWTAYYLARARPDLAIAVLEREFVGFGASGRNGGWASALLPMSMSTLARTHGRVAAIAQDRAIRAAVDEVISAARDIGAGDHVAKSGTITLARTPVQLQRARAEVAEARSWGKGEDHIRMLDEAGARALLNASGTMGGRLCRRRSDDRQLRG